MVVQEVRALDREHHVYRVGSPLLGLSTGEVTGGDVARRDAVRIKGRRRVAKVPVGPVGVGRRRDYAPVLAGLLEDGRDVRLRVILADRGDVDVLPVYENCKIFRHELISSRRREARKVSGPLLIFYTL